MPTLETEGGGGAYQCRVVGDEISLASPISEAGQDGGVVADLVPGSDADEL